MDIYINEDMNSCALKLNTKLDVKKSNKRLETFDGVSEGMIGFH